MTYRAIHTTEYAYQRPVSHCLSEARLTPRALAWQKVIESHLEISPGAALLQTRSDYFGNTVSAFSVTGPHDRMAVTASSLVEVEPRDRSGLPALSWEAARDALRLQADAESRAAYEFVFHSPFIAGSEELGDYAKPSFQQGRSLADAVSDLSHRIHEEFVYRPKSTWIEIPLLDVLRRREGVCQDFSHIMIGALRSLHLSARYVSGYLRSGSEVQGSEASHAWVSVFVPGHGWMDIDPTNDVMPSDGHITLAWGRDYGDVAPMKGIALGGGAQKVNVRVSVTPAAPVSL